MTTKKMMFEDTAKVGDKIRAYDFAPRKEVGDCFIEGTVISKGTCDEKYYLCYKIQLSKKVFAGKDVTEKTVDKIWYVPFETSMDDFENEFYPIGKARVMKKPNLPVDQLEECQKENELNYYGGRA